MSESALGTRLAKTSSTNKEQYTQFYILFMAFSFVDSFKTKNLLDIKKDQEQNILTKVWKSAKTFAYFFASVLSTKTYR